MTLVRSAPDKLEKTEIEKKRQEQSGQEEDDYQYRKKIAQNESTGIFAANYLKRLTISDQNTCEGDPRKYSANDADYSPCWCGRKCIVHKWVFIDKFRME